MIPDGVDRALEAVSPGAQHESRKLVVRYEENAMLLGSAGGCGIRVVTERGACVQGAVDDDLQRPGGEQPTGAVDDGPGVQVLRDGVVESLRPHGADDAERSIALCHPAPPCLERPRL